MRAVEFEMFFVFFYNGAKETNTSVSFTPIMTQHRVHSWNDTLKLIKFKYQCAPFILKCIYISPAAGW